MKCKGSGDKTVPVRPVYLGSTTRVIVINTFIRNNTGDNVNWSFIQLFVLFNILWDMADNIETHILSV